MHLFNNSEKIVAEAIGKLIVTNPFLPERVALEKRILGSLYTKEGKT
ncbi:MAG: hypothetical protein U9O87_02305 [Verrucomicrobiota bacterium]|nr:hypothetical protein [Verrucomicrobiota bacterium]